MSRTVLLIVALSVSSLSVPAAAQRGGGGGGSTRMREPMKNQDDFPKGPTLRVRDLEDQSPLKLLIDKRKDLQINDEQLGKLKDAEAKLKESNAPLYKAVDSLIHELRPPVNAPSDEDRARLRDARVGMQRTIDAIHANNDAAAKEAVATFDASQQTRATELLTKQRADGDRMIREKLSPGGERPDRGGV